MSAIEELRRDPSVYVAALPDSTYPVADSLVKRLIDIIGALILLVPTISFILLIGFFVTGDGGPVIFRDKRYGRHGAVFECFKIRTMRNDSERLLADYLSRNENARQEWACDYKLRMDPRVTRLGLMLRKSGLDELPQLWNVLRGDMSLVGPRPIPVSHGEDLLYGRYFELYCHARPGLTGLWQVSGRNDVRYRRRIAMVVYYVRHWSLTMDILILIRTVGALVSARGAY